MSDRNVKHITVNIMEELVAEEVSRQVKRLPENVAEYVNEVEVATFALNRLPALYASSHKGLNKQKLKGKTQYSVQITKAVRQGLAAVRKDVLRYSTPIELNEGAELQSSQGEELAAAKAALAEFGKYFPEGKVSWKQLLRVVTPMLERHHAVTMIRQKNAQNRAENMWSKY